MKNRRLLPLCAAAMSLSVLAGTAVGLDSSGSAGYLAFPGGSAFHEPSNPILNWRLVDVPGSTTVLALWEERLADGSVAPFYAVSFDGRNLAGRVRQTDYTIHLRYAEFDPHRVVPAVPAELRAAEDSTVHMVQFWTVPLPEFRDQITDLGGEVVRFMANHTYVIRMDERARERVEQLPYVRWTGPYHPAYKLDESVLGGLVTGMPEVPGEYHIEVFNRGLEEQEAVAAEVAALGGNVVQTDDLAFWMIAQMTPAQILTIARRDDVNFIDPWSDLEPDVNLAKILNGAVPVVSNAGFTGQGLRGEIYDTGVDNHPDYSPVLISGGGGGGGHGGNVAGIVFGDATNRGGDPNYKGFLPDREQTMSANGTGGLSRHAHTAKIINPSGIYRAVFQTASVGSARTCLYTSISAQTDDYLFLYRLLSTQSQSNASLNCESRPQAWAKNIVSVGGITHGNSLNRDLHRSSGSTGPAADGRIKPDLAHFYDNIRTTSGSSGYTEGFGGTSGATPLTVGNFGLFFQMWHEEVFEGRGGGASVFHSRPSFMTAKAILINTAHRYDWYSPSAPTNNRNMWRTRQGWGMADIGTIFERRDRLFFVDEEAEILPLQTHEYRMFVEAGEPSLDVTMCYADPAGNPASSVHRINDLSLRVTSPSGVQYWGNNGLMNSNWSSPGGGSNTRDTVENVFIQNPQSGVWLIEVIADEIVAPGIPFTSRLAANYALVPVGGVEASTVCYPDCDQNGQLDFFDFLCFQNVFLAGNPYADCDGNGVLDFFDFLCFQNEFLAGCP